MTVHSISYGDGSIFVKLKYGEPDFQEKLAQIQSLPSRKYDNKSRVWIVPDTLHDRKLLAKIGLLNDSDCCQQKQCFADEEFKKAIYKKTEKWKTLFKYQRDGVVYLSSRKKSLLGDDMGLGKTAQVIVHAEINNLYPVLVVCPASLKINWFKEFVMWAGKESSIVNGSSWSANKNSKIVIVNYDILDKHIDSISKMKFKLMVLDESHYIKNEKTKRYKAVKKIGSIDNLVAVSGTPIENRPREFWSTLQLIDPVQFSSFWNFARRYCGAKHNRFGWDFNGSSNTEELYERLNGTIMLRRKKEDVLLDLPDKSRFHVYVDIPTDNCYNDWLKVRDDSQPIIQQLQKMKVLAAKAKIDGAIEWLENFVETGKKIIVFAIHHDIVDTIVERMSKLTSVVKLDGRDSPQKRDAAVVEFQNNPECKVFVGNIDAAGVGITLTAASSVAFFELDWTPGAHIQAEDRAYRIGQKNNVSVWYLLAANTIEEDIFDLLYEKKKVIDSILDGASMAGESIMWMLAKKYIKQGVMSDECQSDS